MQAGGEFFHRGEAHIAAPRFYVGHVGLAAKVGLRETPRLTQFTKAGAETLTENHDTTDVSRTAKRGTKQFHISPV